jgi:hypothetical protein
MKEIADEQNREVQPAEHRTQAGTPPVHLQGNDEAATDNRLGNESPARDGSEKSVIRNAAATGNKPEPLTGGALFQAIAEASMRLDHSNPEHWTATGMPKLQVVAELAGVESVDRLTVTQASAGMRRIV